MPTAISANKRDDITQRLAIGEAPHAIAVAVGVGRTTVRRYAAKLKEAGGIPAVQSGQVGNIPAAQAYVEGDDGRDPRLAGPYGPEGPGGDRCAFWLQARNVHSSSRSCDVAELYEILHYAAHQSKAVLGSVATDEQLRDWWTGVIDHIRAQVTRRPLTA